jgi:uncharacterized protein YjbK
VKLRLPSKEAYERVVQLFGGKGKEEYQENHYFDGSKREL